MASLKNTYQRFRAWQLKPRNYQEMSIKTHHCSNCDYEYVGAFCPRCGQKAVAGRITWDTVRRGMLDIFGLGGRSLPYSLWQLMWRPGYFISDYINGKWQVSFPPVKMLVIVAVLVFFLGKLLFPVFWNELLDGSSLQITSTGFEYYVDYAIKWLGENPEWAIFFAFSLLIIPTWIMFRYSPVNSRHTVPQGFFIQVFMAVQFIIWLFVISPMFMLCGYDDLMAAVVVLALMFLVTLVDYKQLFGYSWWGTLWRLLCMPFIVICSVFLITVICTLFGKWNADKFNIIKILMVIILCASAMGLELSVIDVINRRLWRKRGLWRSMLWPLLFIAAIVIASLIIAWVSLGYLSRIIGLFS